jgi:hypothetical protein
MEARPEWRSGTCEVTRSLTVWYVPQLLRALASKIKANALATRFAIRLGLGKLWIVVRVILLLIVFGLLGGCADTPLSSSSEKHEPVPGEATPAPESGPRGGWAW